MFLQSLLQICLVWIAFLSQTIAGSCERPPWTRVGWDITLEDLMQVSQEKYNGIHVLYASCTVALFILALLSVYYLLFKWKRPRRSKGTVQAPGSSDDTEIAIECSPNTEKVLFRLVVNTSKMVKYMRCLHYYEQGARHHKLRNKTKVKEVDQEQLFPVCSLHCRSAEKLSHMVSKQQ